MPSRDISLELKSRPEPTESWDVFLKCVMVLSPSTPKASSTKAPSPFHARILASLFCSLTPSLENPRGRYSSSSLPNNL